MGLPKAVGAEALTTGNVSVSQQAWTPALWESLWPWANSLHPSWVPVSLSERKGAGPATSMAPFSLKVLSISPWILEGKAWNQLLIASPLSFPYSRRLCDNSLLKWIKWCAHSFTWLVGTRWLLGKKVSSSASSEECFCFSVAPMALTTKALSTHRKSLNLVDSPQPLLKKVSIWNINFEKYNTVWCWISPKNSSMVVL